MSVLLELNNQIEREAAIVRLGYVQTMLLPFIGRDDKTETYKDAIFAIYFD